MQRFTSLVLLVGICAVGAWFGRAGMDLRRQGFRWWEIAIAIGIPVLLDMLVGWLLFAALRHRRQFHGDQHGG